MEIIGWDIYEIKTESSSIVGVMYRGRLRKFCLEKNRNILVENAEDAKNVVRFAIPKGEDPTTIIEFINIISPDATIVMIRKNTPNPILSKLKVNIEKRYTL